MSANIARYAYCLRHRVPTTVPCEQLVRCDGANGVTTKELEKLADWPLGIAKQRRSSHCFDFASSQPSKQG
jgi:hypothetical protein